MKKIFLIVALLATSLTQNTFSQDRSVGSSDILTQYYAIKDALVNGNSATASSSADGFLKIASSTLPETNRVALLKDAANISKTNNLKKQREYFSVFSDNMSALAKSTKLSTSPVYIAYCPMKKASWLSSSSAIKNPYYGNAMLTCGKVVKTLQ